jgi:N-methylhydantoinase B
MDVDLQALAAPRGRLTTGAVVDPVTAEVLRGAMETVCYEMAMFVSRTATTPILNQSNERNARSSVRRRYLYPVMYEVSVTSGMIGP